MIKHIRPHEVFCKIKGKDGERTIQVVLPHKHTPLLLETAILVALSKYVNTEEFFEFGTYLGVETLNILMNLKESSTAWTLDLDRESFKNTFQAECEKVLSERHFEFEHNLAFLNTPWEKRITRLFGDSKKFEFSKYYGKFDFIYIDGGHDTMTLKSDTNNAFRMLHKTKISCIAWHDYGNPNFPELKQFLDELAVDYDIFHVEETMLCFYISNPSDETYSFL